MRDALLRVFSVLRPFSQLHSLTAASVRASAGVCRPSLSPQRASGTTMAEEYMLQIDGSVMEGGGQILRVATSLSCILGIPVRLHSIRAGRSTPGLRPQHLSGLEMIRDLCEGQLERGEIGSTEVIFTPGKIKGGTHTADTKTAGSVCLLMQVSLPCVLFAAGPTELYLKGGTNAEMAPQIDYTVKVFKPIVEKFSFKIGCDIKTRGYYPRGGGEVVVRTSPVKKLTAINLTDRGTVTKIHGRAFVAGVLPYKIAKDMAAAAERCIKREIKDINVNVQAVQESKDHAFGNGNGIMLFAETSTGCIFAGSALGKRGVSAEKVAGDAADMLLRNLRHGGCVDEFLQDQLIIFMALAEGVSKIRTGPVTLHSETAIHFAEQLTKATFSVKKSDDQEGDTDNYIIECQGIGLINPNI